MFMKSLRRQFTAMHTAQRRVSFRRRVRHRVMVFAPLMGALKYSSEFKHHGMFEGLCWAAIYGVLSAFSYASVEHVVWNAFGQRREKASDTAPVPGQDGGHWPGSTE